MVGHSLVKFDWLEHWRSPRSVWILQTVTFKPLVCYGGPHRTWVVEEGAWTTDRRIWCCQRSRVRGGTRASGVSYRLLRTPSLTRFDSGFHTAAWVVLSFFFRSQPSNGFGIILFWRMYWRTRGGRRHDFVARATIWEMMVHLICMTLTSMDAWVKLDIDLIRVVAI
jgi:hypothetical protein